ncbi:hypothetical protein M9458_014968, partial [Cirrhinus mrigala]
TTRAKRAALKGLTMNLNPDLQPPLQIEAQRTKALHRGPITTLSRRGPTMKPPTEDLMTVTKFTDHS